MKKLIITTLLLMLLFPISAMSKGNDDNAMSKEVSDWYFGAKTRIFNKIDSLISNKGIIYDKLAFELLLCDGNITGDGEAIEYVNKILSYENSSPEALIEALNLLRYWNDILIKSTRSTEANKSLLRSEGKYPPNKDDVDIFLRLKSSIMTSLKKLIKSKFPYIKIEVIETLYALDFQNKDNATIKDILINLSKGIDEKNWNLTAIPLKGRTLKSNFVKFQALTLLFKYDYDKAVEISEDIIKNYVPNKSRKMKKYENYPEEVRKILLKNQKQNHKDKSPSDTKATGSIYDHIWNADNSADYCKDYWTDYNDSYTPFGSDCANFGSQCLIAGGIDLSAATENAVSSHPCGKTTVVNCDALNDFLIDDRTDFMTQLNTNSSTTIPNWYRAGDIATVGAPDDILKHTIICHPDSNNTSTLSFGCHTTDHINKSLSWWLSGVYADRITFYHVIGSTVLVEPSKDIMVSLVDTLNLKAMVTNNTEPTSLNEITDFKFILKKKPANTTEILFTTTSQPSVADSTYIFDFETAAQDTGLYVLIAETTYSEGTTIDSCFLKIKPIPEIISPLPDDLYPIKPPGKAIVTDTLKIKIKVPQVSGSYPNIKLKIDDVYVNQADIAWDDSVYVYPWDLSTVTSDPDGKRFKIEAELFDDPNCSGVSSVFTVEAVFLEHFQEITDLTAEDWTIYSYEWPLQTYIGWMLGPDPTYIAGEKCVRTYSTYSTSFTYQLWTPAFTVPDSDDSIVKLEYKLYYKKLNSPNSYIYFDVCNESGIPLGTTQMLGPMYGTWTDMNYDLSAYSNQTIKLRWNHSYTNGIQYCNSTSYALDNIAVYVIPDMDYPNIDFVYENQANVNQDMNIKLQFNDESDIESVTADYEIEGDSDTITLTLGKNTYNYTGTISARDHECSGDIVFTVKDVIGNEIISDTYDIYWTDTTQPPASPGNLEFVTENDSTITISWEMVQGASEYKVYTSDDPYGAFTIDSTGTFISSTQWQKNTNTNKKFYYVVATNTSKKKDKIEIIKDLKTKDK